MRSSFHELSKPVSTSAEISGPRFGLPLFFGTNAGLPFHAPDASQVRTASNAPGARPDRPYAARSFTLPHLGQKLSPDSTHEPLTFGYVCSPKPEPNALLPSTRRPSVRKY